MTPRSKIQPQEGYESKFCAGSAPIPMLELNKYKHLWSHITRNIITLKRLIATCYELRDHDDKSKMQFILENTGTVIYLQRRSYFKD